MIHVLYAEDDRVIAALVGSCFARFGTKAVLEVAPTGRACLDRMARGGIDVLLLDLELPDTNGLRILGELALRGDVTPVIMVSGQGQTDLAVKALRAGAVDCVDKGSPQFLQIVELVTRVHERRQAAAVDSLQPGGAPGEVRRLAGRRVAGDWGRDRRLLFQERCAARADDPGGGG